MLSADFSIQARERIRKMRRQSSIRRMETLKTQFIHAQRHSDSLRAKRVARKAHRALHIPRKVPVFTVSL